MKMEEKNSEIAVPKPGINRIIGITAGAIAELLNYLIVAVSGSIIVADLAKLSPDWAWLVMLSVVPLFYYFVREKIDRLIIFLILHLLPVLGVLLGYQGHVAQKIVLLLVVCFLAVYSFSRRMNSIATGIEAVSPPVAAGILWALYQIDKSQGTGSMGMFLLYVAVGFIAGYFIFYFLRQFLCYIDVNNRTTENIPVNHVFYSAAALAGGFTCFSAIVILLVSDKEMIDRIGETIRKVIVGIISYFFSLRPEADIKWETTERVGGGINLMELLGPASEKSLFMEIMDVILVVAGVMITLVIIMMAIINAVKFVRAGFARKGNVRMIENEIHEDKVENLKKEKKKKSREKDSSFWEDIGKLLSPEEKIRRIYRKTIEKGAPAWEGEKKALLLQKATARECCMALFPEKSRDAAAFACLYEKARYGKSLCRSEDVREAKRLAQTLQMKNR